MNILVTQYVCDNFIPQQLLPVHTKAHIENREIINYSGLLN